MVKIAINTAILVLLFTVFLLSLMACTYSVTLAHTQGTATDLIDETQSAQPDIKPNLNFPGL